MRAPMPLVALVTFAFSLLLQGCELPWNVRKDEPATPASAPDDAASKKDVQKASLDEGTAACENGKFSCSGGKKWCAEQIRRCSGSECTPRCTWKCNTPQCDQVCAPVCAKPVCSTRCKGFNTDGCKMVCGKPNCVVICPKYFCPNQQCSKCKTKCSEPVCKMACGDEEQDCRNVCAQPQCKWNCQKPSECPKPHCKMVCDKATNCMGDQMVKQLPPLQPGEMEVAQEMAGMPAAGAAPAPAAASMLVLSSELSTMRVNITTMGSDSSLAKREIALPLAAELQVGTTWKRKVQTHISPGGQATRSEASCQEGAFQCHGDKAWCAEQEKTMCEGPHHAFLQQRQRAQGQLRA